MVRTRDYEPEPCYAPAGGRVSAGWSVILDGVARGGRRLAIDGPAALDWGELLASVSWAARAAGVGVRAMDIRGYLASWDQIVKRTGDARLADDPDFARLATGHLADLFNDLPCPAIPAEGIVIVYGPGAGLVDHDVLWYVELPKRYAEAAIKQGRAGNLGQPAAAPAGTLRRLFYVDWPLLDRHRDELVEHIDRWIDIQNPDRPTSVDGAVLRHTMAALAERPFRTRPTFNTTTWGGHWAQRTLGFNPEATNTALGYELIAPESGILIGDCAALAIEVPFQLLVSAHPERLLGARVHQRFGASFPIRFDYLDTVDGGNLSVHCHPRERYMREVFGWPYTQHETYYIMVGGQDRQVFLGLRDAADVDAFHRHSHAADETGAPMDIQRFVQTFPAMPHQLFLVPAGTPHGAGAGNVVLEISATPYLYSLRFYDWLRGDHAGRRRPVHVEHAFRNLDASRSGAAVGRDLVPTPRTLRTAAGWREDLLGALPEMFFQVRRFVLDPGQTATDDTADRFHILTVVDGAGVVLDTERGHRHRLRYAETLVVPGVTGRYRLQSMGNGPTRVVKAVVA